MVHHHSYVTGGHCDFEHFGEPDKLNDRLSTNTTESCNVYNMLRLTRMLFGWRPEADVADFYERALLNHIRSTQHPDGRVIYNLSLKPGHHKQYLAVDSFTCCGGTGLENHVKYGEAIYFHGDNDLWINLFIASELQWKTRRLALRQKTQWPLDDKSTITITCEQPQNFSLRIRHPYWATEGMRIAINDQPVEVHSTPSSYASLRRRWESGDRVVVEFPMSLRTESMPDNKERIAVFFGPVLLAATLGRVSDPEAIESADVPVLITDGKPVARWVRTESKDRQIFVTDGVGKPRDVTLVPFHSLHEQRYTVFLDIFTRAEWASREAKLRAAQERERQLAVRTVDLLRIGEMQPERDHHLQGERTGAGEHLGRKWRHAVDGGWFSFEMKVDPHSANELLCTYWGGETGRRTFDVFVDETRIAEQTLLNNVPGQFFDVKYAIPASLTDGKQHVTVKLKAHPGHFAGGLFGCRVLKKSQEPTE